MILVTEKSFHMNIFLSSFDVVFTFVLKQIELFMHGVSSSVQHQYNWFHFSFKMSVCMKQSRNFYRHNGNTNSFLSPMHDFQHLNILEFRIYFDFWLLINYSRVLNFFLKKLFSSLEFTSTISSSIILLNIGGFIWFHDRNTCHWFQKLRLLASL